MPATDFNPTGNPRCWQGLPGVKYPEELAAESMARKAAEEKERRRPKHCPPGYIPLREAALMLHLSEAQTRLELKKAGVEYVHVKPVFGCEYHAWPEAGVMEVRRLRAERLDKWRH